MNYYLGPWVWDTSDPDVPHWRAPAGTVGLYDLRGYAACATPVKHDHNVGFFATPTDLGSDYDLVGTQLDGNMASKQRAAWVELLGLEKLDAATSLAALWELRTYRAGPDNDIRMQSALPGIDRRLTLSLGGHGLLKSEKFTGVGHYAWAAMQRVLWKNYSGIRDQALDESKPMPADQHQKWLTVQLEKLGLTDHKLFIPSGLPDEQPKPHDSSVSDDFNRGDESLDAGPWVEAVGTAWNVVSNEVRDDNAPATVSAYHTTPLSSDDHFAQVVETARENTSAFLGPLVRQSAIADTHYRCVLSNVTLVLQKLVAGTPTNLDSTGVSVSLPDTPKLQANGSAQEGFWNGVSEVTAADATISGNLNAGLAGRGGTHWSTGDDFEAADLAVAGSSWYYNLQQAG